MSIIQCCPDWAPLSNSVQSTASKKSSKKLREVEKSRQFKANPAGMHACWPTAGIIEESESAWGERGRVGQGRVGFQV